SAASLISAIFITHLFASELNQCLNNFSQNINNLWRVEKILEFYQPSEFISQQDLNYIKQIGPSSLYKKLQIYPICPDAKILNLKGKLLNKLSESFEESCECFESCQKICDKDTLELFLVDNLSKRNIVFMDLLAHHYSLKILEENCKEFAKKR